MFKRLSLGETALAHFRELHEGLNPLGHLAAVGDGAGRGVDRDRQSQHGAPGGRRPRAGSGIAIGDADAADKHRNGGRPGAVRAIRRHPRGHGDVHLVVLRVGARVNDAGGPGGDCSRGGIQGRPQTAQAIPEPLNEGRAAPVRGAPPPLSAPHQVRDLLHRQRLGPFDQDDVLLQPWPGRRDEGHADPTALRWSMLPLLPLLGQLTRRMLRSTTMNR